MQIYTNPYSLRTWKESTGHFRSRGEFIVGFPAQRRNYAKLNAVPGSRLVCYIGGEKKIAGILEVIEYLPDHSEQIWTGEATYPVRLKVQPLFLIEELENAIDFETLYPQTNSFKVKHAKGENTNHWGHLFQGSLKPIDPLDYAVYEEALRKSPFAKTYVPVKSLEPSAPASGMAPDNNDIDGSLIWLKDRFDQGLIPEALYLRKIESLIDRRIG